MGLAGTVSCVDPVATELPDSVLLKGSDTMRDLVTICGNAFSEKHPQIQVRVAGGGSGTGIYALMSGLTEVAMSSRDLTDREEQIARRKGFSVHRFVVAQDGMVLIVHPQNPVAAVKMEDLQKIFRGDMTDWSSIEGPSTPIQVHVREPLSGTQLFFRNEVLKGAQYTESVTVRRSNRAMLQAVSESPHAIGYVGLMYARNATHRIRILPIGAKETATMPSRTSIRSGQYPLARPLYLMTIVEPSGTVKRFIDFMLGPEGQALVQKTGFIQNETPR